MAILIVDGKRLEVPDVTMDGQQFNDWAEDKPIRVIIPEEVKREWLLKYAEHQILGNNAEIYMLVEYVKSVTLSMQNNGGLVIYLTELYPEHEWVLKNNGAIVERKNE